VAVLGAAAAFASGAPASATVGGAVPFTYTVGSGGDIPNHYASQGEGCGNAVDPIKLQAGNDQVLFPDSGNRGYDAIQSVTVGASESNTTAEAGVLHTGPADPAVGQTPFTVTLCKPIPRFPNTAGTDGVDSGVGITVCVSPNTVINSAPELIGVNGDGGAIWDGPYPGNQGYRWCSFFGSSAGTDASGNPQDVPLVAAGIFDPVESLTYNNSTILHDLNGTQTIQDPTCNAGTLAKGFQGATQCTIWLPDCWEFATGNSSPLTLESTDKLTRECFIAPGSTVNDWSVTTEVSLEALTLPFPVCLDTGQQGNGGGTPTLPLGLGGTHSCGNPPPHCCDTINPIQGILSLNVTTDSAPGVYWCSSPGACGSDPSATWDFGILPSDYPAGQLTNPASGAVECVTTWTYLAEYSGAGGANTNNWGPYPGQDSTGKYPSHCTPNGITAASNAGPPWEQDRGLVCDLATLLTVPALGCNTSGPSGGVTAGALPRAASYTSVYGRGPNPIVIQKDHAFAQYNNVPGVNYCCAA
jgi:hypothetical protein